MSPTTAIGPGVESVLVELYGVDPDAARWDVDVWDGPERWGATGWNGIGCQVGEVSSRWGATDEAGILSIASSGGIDLRTIDPARVLDPTNAASPFWGSVRPGVPLRYQCPSGAVLANPGFDDAPPLTGWTLIGTAEQSALAGAPNGGYTLRIVGDGTATAPAALQNVPVRPGETFTATAWVRVAAGATAVFRLDAMDGATGGRLAVVDTVQSTSTTFVQLRAGGSVPAGTTHLRVVCTMLGSPAGLAVRFDALTLTGGQVAATAFLDEASYDLAAGRGTIRAIDGIAYLAQAQVPDGAVLPNTLRARVRAVVAAVGLAGLVPVEADPPDSDADPAVAPHDGKARAAWAIITDAGTDALTYVYLGPLGVLRFRSFGALPDGPVGIGCPPPGDAGSWVEGISTILSTVQAGAIRNQVRAYSAGTTFTPPAIDALSVGRYGPRALDVTRIVPDFANWSARILQDRADAGVAVDLGMVRPYDRADLDALLAIQSTGPCVLAVVDDAHPPPIAQDVAVIGAQIGVTPAGWRFKYVSMIPRAAWTPLPPPPEPPVPPPNPYHTETRTYIATSDALLALTSGGAKYGAGAATSSPVGAWQGWTYRAAVKFPSIPWTKIRAVKSATLQLRTTTQVRVGFGSSPTIEVRRITESWSAGSSSSPSSGNAVVYPGPSSTSAGAVRANVSKNQSTDVSIRIDKIARAWGPAAVGGSSAPQQGVILLPGSGALADTTEFWPVEQGGAARPTLVLVLEVFD